MPLFSYEEYIDYHIKAYGTPPKAYILQKYYPDKFKEEDAAPDERITHIIPSHVDMVFGCESEVDDGQAQEQGEEYSRTVD